MSEMVQSLKMSVDGRGIQPLTDDDNGFKLSFNSE